MATTIQDVIASAKKYNRKTDTKLIKRAFEYANNAHKDQKGCLVSHTSYILWKLLIY